MNINIYFAFCIRLNNGETLAHGIQRKEVAGPAAEAAGGRPTS